MVIDSKTTYTNAADNVVSGLVCEAWLPSCSKEWNRCLRAFDLRLQQSGLAFYSTDKSDHVLGS